MVIPILLYICETLVTYRKHLKNLECQPQHFLQKILNIKWEDHHTNVSVLTEANVFSDYPAPAEVEQALCVHALCMLTKTTAVRQLTKGERKWGGQKKCFKDTLNINIKRCGIDTTLGDSSPG
ncbi:hypothetical protein KIL84_016777 [Mauremys mutica]|uniref:Uncharacterized protein n=1 Tax=Mauremys mutica TaxID=74926 RepID=A0A9D3X536_9SAUR|nr:hypothetical protein KIL84_016777 [Mauremys mutica]